MRGSSVFYTNKGTVEGQLHAWDGAPPEIWDQIFDFASLLPRYADLDASAMLHPDDYFSPDMRYDMRVAADDELRRSIRYRIKMSQVCVAWRSANIEKAYEHLYVNDFSQLEPLCKSLERSCISSRPEGFGRCTKQFSWTLRGERGDQDYEPRVVQLLVKILSHLPKFRAFSQSQQWGSLTVPSEVIDALLEYGLTQSLRRVRIIGPVYVQDLSKLSANFLHLTALSVGKITTPEADETPWSLPMLRSLHVELSLCRSTPHPFHPFHHDLPLGIDPITHFTDGQLPRLEQFSVLLCLHDGRHSLLYFLAEHGHKIKLLRIEVAKTCCLLPVYLSSMLSHCPNVTDLIIDLDVLHNLEHLEIQVPIHRLGILMVEALTNIYTQMLPRLPVRSQPLQELRVLRHATLPRALRYVRVVDMGFDDMFSVLGDAFARSFLACTLQ